VCFSFATDLVNFLGCRHATYLDRRDLTDPSEIPVRDAVTVLIFDNTDDRLPIAPTGRREADAP
jgi:hypothetical protein